MPTPEYRVESLSAVRQNRLRVVTEVPGDAALFVEYGDALNPTSWLLTGSPAPRVVAGDVAQDGAERTILLDLDAPLTPGAAYSLALQPWARSKYGQATKTDAVAFVAPFLLAAAGTSADVPGADISFPPIADSRGDLVRIDRVAALRARVLLLVSSRRGSFAFASMEEFGRGVEPKRTYSPTKLLSEATALKRALLIDPDVKDADVSTREIAGGAVAFDLVVTPSFDGPPLAVSQVIRAGETP